MNQHKTFIERNGSRMSPEDVKVYFQKLNEKSAKSVTALLTILSEDTIEKFIEAIEIQFARRDAMTLSISNVSMLELYTDIYEKKLRKFNFVELGILSDMFYKDYPADLVEDIFGSIKDYLKFKIELQPLPKAYHSIKVLIDTEITKEMEIRRKISAPNSAPILTPNG